MDDFQALGHTGLAHGPQAIQEGAADVHAACAQRPGAQHVLAGAHTAVHVHLDLAAHGLNDGRQRLDARLRAIELAAAVVGDDQRVGTRLHSQLRVFHVLDALEDQLAAPALLDPFHIAPVERRVELRGGPA